jgi:SMI1-KNR4 cell-wall
LLLEADGIWGPAGAFGLIWPVERIIKDNTTFRTEPGFRKLYMPFDHLLFFGDDGSGDQFAFRILAGAVNDLHVYRWVHENDAREWSASGLHDYVARSLWCRSFNDVLDVWREVLK